MYETKKSPSIDDGRGCVPSLRATLAFEEYVRKKADGIGEILLIEVVRAGPGGMECDRFCREDPAPFRTDPRDGVSEGVSWHLTISYGGPAGDALGSRARWSERGEIAAEGVIDAPGLAEAQASGRLAGFFKETAIWLESEVRPRGLATEDRIKEGAKIARDLARDLEICRNLEKSQNLNKRMRGDLDLRS